MRIISQDGMIDVNYDLGNLSIAKGAGNRENDRSIYFHSCSCSSSTKLATYSTEEKSKKAMDMLRKAYSPILVIDDVSDEHIKADIKPFITPIRAGRPNIEVLDNYYFQFPADHEIEV